MRVKVRNRKFRLLLLAVLVSLGAWLFVMSSASAESNPEPGEIVEAAWEKAREAGAYHFSSDILQVTIPAVTLRNIGNGSHEDRFYLEGQTDLRAQEMRMTLLSDSTGGGSLLIPNSGLQIQSVDGVTRARRGSGDWETIDSFADGFAPQGDFLSYLAAAADVTELEAEMRQGIRFRRFAFDVDGPVFASYLRDQTQAALRARGDLPPKVQLGPSDYYADMRGTGELWIGDDGLPIRQVLELDFPEQNGERVNAQISVDFSDFAEPAGQLAFLGDGEQLLTATRTASKLLLVAAVALLFVGGLLFTRRSRTVVAVLAFTIIASMLFSPLLEAAGLENFVEAQRAEAAKREQTKAEQDYTESVRQEMTTTSFNPLADPLQQEPVEPPPAPPPTLPPDLLQSLVEPTAEIPTMPSTAGDSQQAELASALSLLAAQGNCPDPGHSDCDGLSDEFELELGTVITMTDTDGDGLDDFQELTLGTVPYVQDTDGDLLWDGVEVAGYSFGGQIWRSDPRQADSNRDGISDAVESGPDVNDDGVPDTLYDTDGDGQPDMFDEDNDNDGVPDEFDASPLKKGGPFYATSRLELVVDDLIEGEPSKIDFQLRPLTANHLWYAFNVLDWPEDDGGQVRDVDNATFRDVFNRDGYTPPESLSHGDLRLTPMLEIEVMGLANNLPAQDDLIPYNITLTDITVDGTRDTAVIGQRAYVPLSLVTDRSGARLAFAAQLPLMPDADWGSAYQIRMVWTVEMLLDYCLEYGAGSGQCIDELNNQLMPIHTYDDPFVLTGLQVQEEQGVETAIIYEDPSDVPPEDDPDLRENELLWSLADAFDGTFLSARYITGTTQLDMGLDEIARRFDHRTNHDGANDPTLEQRWNLPNYLVVERTAEDDYDTMDQAIASITMTRTGQILDSAFSPFNSPGSPITPSLMFAQEQLYRGVSLDQLDSGNGQAVLTGNQLTIDFAPEGVALYPERLRSLKWAAYCGEQAGAETQWNECPAEDYWLELDRRFGQSIAEPGDTPEMTLGRLLILKNFWVTLTRGVNNIVESEGIVMTGSIWDPVSDNSLSKKLAKGGATVIKALIDGPLSQFSKLDALEAVGYKFTSKVDRAKAVSDFGKKRGSSLGLLKLLWPEPEYKIVNGKLKNVKALRNGVIQVGVVLVVGAIIFSQAARVAWPDSPEAVMSGRLAMVAIQLIAEVILPIVSTMQWASTMVTDGVAASKGQALSKMARGKSLMAKNSARANMAGAKFVLAVAWGFFLYTVISEGVAVGSPQFNKGFATMLATTIVVLVLAVIASNPVGLFIGVALALVDAVLAIICAIKSEKTCDSVTGEIIEFLAKVLYSYELMIEVDPKKNPDLTQIGAAAVTLNEPVKGYAAGASLSVSVPVTTSIRHRFPDSGDWKIQEYLHLFSAQNLRSSTFSYTLSSVQNGAQPLNVERYQMSDQWQGVTPFYYYSGQPLYKGFVADQPGFGVTLSQAGLNQGIDYYFNSAYAIPAYECWLLGFILPIPVCYVRTKEGNSSTLTPGPERDIFPATIDGFMAQVASGEGGYRLGWDDHFTTLWDADGDGLISMEKGGIDPDDGRWDSDGDWLPDTYELEQGFDGIAYSPLSPDTDGDGLIDSQELEYGTSPNRYDTDLDGLSDGQEVYHRVYALNVATNRMEPTDVFTGGLQIRIAPFGEPLTTTNPSPNTYTVIVSSDPTERDPDGDGVPDDAEYLLNERGVRDPNGHAYNPNAYNEPPLQVYVAADSGGLYIGPGQQVNYTTTVVALADFEPGVLEVTAPDAMGLAGPQTYAMPAMTAVASQTFGTAYTVQQSASTQTVTLQSLATASLAADPGALDWRWHGYGVPLPLGVGLGDYQGVNSVSARPDSARDYLLSGFTSSVLRRGDIDLFSVELDSNVVVTSALDTDGDDLLATRSWVAPDVVCNAAGKCLTVWDDEENCNEFVLSWLAVENDSDTYSGESQGLEMFVTWTPDASLGSGPGNAPPGAEENLWRYDWFNPPYVNQLAGATITEGIAGLTREFCAPESAEGAQIKVYEYDAGFGAAYGEVIGTLKLLPENMGGYAIRIGPSYEGARVQVGYYATPKQRHVLKGAWTDRDGQPPQGEFSLPISQAQGVTTGDLSPAVATDGQNFLVAWNHMVIDDSNPALGSVTSYIQTQLYDANGVAIGGPQSYSGLQSKVAAFNPVSSPFFQYEQGFNVAGVVPNVIWAGDRYRLIWSAGEAGINSRLAMVDVASNGVPDFASYELVTTTAHSGGQGTAGAPQLAYEPGTGLVRVAYTDSSSVLTTKMYHVASGAAIDTKTYDTGGNYPSMPSVAYYPQTDGWMLSWYEPSTDLLKVAALRLDGLEMMDRAPANSVADLESGRGRPLSCPATSSVPFVRWALEELPGSTTFNSTGSGNYATCSGVTCPRTGAGGVGEAVFPDSDRALYFDGQDDRIDLHATTGQLSHDFSVAFWVKTDGPTTGDYLSDSNVLVRSEGTIPFGIGVGLGGQVKIGVGAEVAGAGAIGDGEWHHVAINRNSNNGVVYLYVDGVWTGGWSFSATGSLGDDHGLTLGHTSGSPAFRGWMDEVLVYEAVLYGESLHEILSRTRDHSCLLSAVADAGIRTYRFGLDQADNRTGAIQAGAGLTLRLDADPPRTTVGTPAPIYFQVPAAGSVTRIIGGTSEDDESGVIQVEISVDGGPFEPVNGTGTWAYDLLMAAGVTTVQANGTDAVGNVETTGQIQQVIGDADPPMVWFDSLPVNTFPLRSIDGDWMVAIDGHAEDPTIEGWPGSGVNQELVEIQLEAEDGIILPWQKAGGGTNPWHIDYVIPLGIGDPTGQYTMTVRVADYVGNAAEFVETITVHLPKVSAEVGYDDAQIDVITQTVSIDGLISSTVGIASVDAAFVPIEQMAVMSGTTMILSLDEPANAVRFDDSSPYSNNGICTDGCPTAGAPGVINTGITLDGSTSRVIVPHAPSISFADDESFSFQAWIKTSATNETIFSKDGGDFNKGIFLYINSSGHLELWTGGTKILEDTNPTNDGEWNLVTVAVDRGTNEARLYVGTLEKQFGPLSGSTANDGPLVIGGWEYYGDFAGSIDEVMVWNRALTRSDVLATAAMRDLNWRGATLTGEATTPLSQGREMTTADWHINVPDQIEGFHRLDLRLTDDYGRIWQLPSGWSAIVDTLAPRVTIGTTVSQKRTWQDPATGQPRYDLAYTFEARDLHLDLKSFQTACDAIAQPARNYIDRELNAWVDEIFPDSTWRNYLSYNCHAWAEEANPTVQIDACDIYGNCSSESTGVDTSSVIQPSLNVMVVSPLKDQVINGLSLPQSTSEPGSVELEIQVAANSSTPLRAVRLFFNMGWPDEQVKSIDYAEAENKLRVLETFVVTIPAEGEYTLDVQAVNYPIGPLVDAEQIAITLDMSQPTGAILTESFTEAEAYTLGSGLMRLHGWASDPLGLSAVQVNVDDGPWQAATLYEDGSWHTAVYIGADKYGQNVDVKMRAFDWSGNSTVIAKSLLVDIEAPVVLWAAFAAESVTVNEGDGAVELTVNLSAASSNTVSVQYATSPGTASAVSDYTSKSGTLTFDPGVTSRTISIPIVEDDEIEQDETFTLTLSAPNGATLGIASTVTITIRDGASGGYAVFLPLTIK